MTTYQSNPQTNWDYESFKMYYYKIFQISMIVCWFLLVLCNHLYMQYSIWNVSYNTVFFSLVPGSNMVRNQQRKPSARKYHDFSAENLTKLLKAVSDKSLAMCKAAEEYGILLATLRRKIRAMHSISVGCQCVLLAEDEKLLAHGLVLSSERGFPLQRLIYAW